MRGAQRPHTEAHWCFETIEEHVGINPGRVDGNLIATNRSNKDAFDVLDEKFVSSEELSSDSIKDLNAVARYVLEEIGECETYPLMSKSLKS